MDIGIVLLKCRHLDLFFAVLSVVNHFNL